MTDTARMLSWLRETLDVAEKRADRWHDVECLVHDISLADAVVLQGATLCVCDGPAAVLRRIAADRQLLELHAQAHECSSWDEVAGDFNTCQWVNEWETCSTVRLLAEGWGWTEETSGQ